MIWKVVVRGVRFSIRFVSAAPVAVAANEWLRGRQQQTNAAARPPGSPLIWTPVAMSNQLTSLSGAKQSPGRHIEAAASVYSCAPAEGANKAQLLNLVVLLQHEFSAKGDYRPR